MTGDTVSSVDLTCRTESLGKISLLHLRQLGVQAVTAWYAGCECKNQGYWWWQPCCERRCWRRELVESKVTVSLPKCGTQYRTKENLLVDVYS